MGQGLTKGDEERRPGVAQHTPLDDALARKARVRALSPREAIGEAVAAGRNRPGVSGMGDFRAEHRMALTEELGKSRPSLGGPSRPARFIAWGARTWSGKSTLIKIVGGVHAPEKGGRIVVEGVSYDRLTPHQAKSLGIQVIYQDLSLFPNLSVLENIAIDHE